MEKYYCKNGETVQVEQFDETTIRVYYKGKAYFRDKTIIGKSLFEKPQAPIVRARIGTVVKLRNVEEDDVFSVYFTETEKSVRYLRTGGPYRRASVEETEGIKINEAVPDDIDQITVNSPIGKECLGKTVGDTFTVLLSNNTKQKYLIEDVYYF